MSADQLTTEMTKNEQAFVNIFGKKPAYMRPPYLETGGSVISVMKSLGYKIITDDVDSQDWNGASVATSESKFTAAGASGNGHIPLMHETYQSTATTLTTWLINWAKQNNLKIVTVCPLFPIHSSCYSIIISFHDSHMLIIIQVAECLGDADGAYQAGTFTGNGQSTC